jgi:streptomycin 6-kinase
MASHPTWLDALSALEQRSVELLGSRGTEWVASCADNVRHAISTWGLHQVEPLAGGRGGLVLAARTAGGRQVVLKAPLVDPNIHIRAQVELALAGVGPGVLREDTQRGLVLLEYVESQTLIRPASQQERELVADSVARLHEHQTEQRFESITTWLSPRLERAPADRSPTGPSVSDGQRTGARRVLSELDASGCTQTLIHADLNVGNVLRRNDGSITLIDARGVSGDPAYDYALLAVKTSSPDAELRALERLAVDLARHSGGASDRAAEWVSVIVAAMV